jgi:3',5'-cyclic AMP phosphodiesterase CpdA
MRVIVHLSDLHFGRLDERIIDPLVERIALLKPDLIAVSGDLTQRALRHQFQHARAFLDRLKFPQIVVPGNHDVPLYNIAARVLDPFREYRRHIDGDLEPSHLDPEMAAVGLNSARALIMGGRGRLNRGQIDSAVARLRPVAADVIKVVVTHHPFDLPGGYPEAHLVGRAEMAMTQLAAVGADLFLAGHLHVSHVGHTAERYKIAGHSALVVQAGTLSTRGRGELNTFNVLRIARPEMTVERYSWIAGGEAFDRSFEGRFQHTAEGWTARGLLSPPSVKNGV